MRTLLPGKAQVLKRPLADLEAVAAACVAHGVWLRPFGTLLYAMPPYVATDDDVAAICAAMAAIARDLG